MYVQFCNEATICAYWLVNETLWYETEMRHLIFSPRRDRDLPTFPQDRDDTKMFGNFVSRPRPRDRDYIPGEWRVQYITRMWANAQRDGHPAEYRWRPLFNTAKFGWHPLLECRAVMLPRRETHWNLQGCPKLANRTQALVSRSSPYYQDMWRRYWCLTSFFFQLSIHALFVKI